MVLESARGGEEEPEIKFLETFLRTLAEEEAQGNAATVGEATIKGLAS
jgi:hypothetical protein